MAIGTPANLGSTNSAADSSTFTHVTTADVVANDLVSLDIKVASSALRSVLSVADTAGNTYAFAGEINDGSTDAHEVWVKSGAGAMATGGTITVTLSAATTGGNGCHIAAHRVSGIAATSAVDTPNIGKQTASTANPSVSTGTLAQADTLLMLYSWRGNGTPTYTEDAAFSNLINAASVGGANGKASVGYKIVAATTPTTGAPAWSTSGRCHTLIVPYKGAAAAAAIDMSSQNMFILARQALGRSMSGWRKPAWRPRRSGLLVPAWQM